MDRIKITVIQLYDESYDKKERKSNKFPRNEIFTDEAKR